MPTTATESDTCETIDHGPDLPSPAPLRQVMLEHAESGKGESGENPDCVEADERIELRLEDDDEQDGHRSQDEDAIGECQPVSAFCQLPGKE